MSDIAIRVDCLSKQYRIGGKQEGYTTLRDTLTDAFVSPFHRAKKLLRGQAYGAAELDETIWALKDISLEIKRGEVIGIIGSNGAGKTTLLKILSRITEPTEGQAEIRGRVGSLLEVGTGFHPELTGRENIYLNGAILGMRKTEIEQKFDEIVDFAEIEKFINTPVKHYSSGMYVRLAFAVAAYLEPEILLVDEVLAVGDVAFQKKCLGKMEDVATKGRTVLFVSHNMAAVQNMCERCLVLREGTVMFNGNTVKAIERYINSTSDKKYGFADLSHHPGRLPHMKPIIQSVALCTDEGSERHRSNVKTGEEVMFEISYDCGDITLNYAMIGICTPLGERVCSVGTHLDPEFIDTLRGRGVLKCHIPELTLVDGEYSLLVAMGTRTGGNIDCVSNALRFRVELGDYFLTGATLLPGQGYLAQKAHWHIISRSKEVG